MLTGIEKNSEILQSLFSESDFVFLSEFENEIIKIDKNVSTLTEYRNIISNQISIEKKSNSQNNLEYSEEILDLVNTNIKNLLTMLQHLKSFNVELVNLLVAIEKDNTNSERFEKDAQYIQSKISEYSQELKENEKILLLDNSKIRAYIVKINNSSSLLSDSLSSIPDKKKKSKSRTKNAEINSSDISLVFNPNNIKDNNKLIISDKRRKVFLPFKISELDEYLQNFENDFESYEDVISQEFIIPIGRFTKNTVVARFRETYALIRDRESRSVFEAIKRGLELMFVYNLNAAIIAACKNEEDLENYLSHLKRKTTENFNRFRIEYEVSPFKVKSFLFNSSFN